MVRTGKVISIDKKNRSGTIRDTKGKTFCFSQAECKGETLPKLFEVVTFEQDIEWTFIKVAILIQPAAA